MNSTKTLFLPVIILMSAMTFPLQADIPADAQASSTVYICTGPKSKRYHATSGCKGLKRCSGSIKAATLTQARNSGRTACRICY